MYSSHTVPQSTLTQEYAAQLAQRSEILLNALQRCSSGGSSSSNISDWNNSSVANASRQRNVSTSGAPAWERHMSAHCQDQQHQLPMALSVPMSASAQQSGLSGCFSMPLNVIYGVGNDGSVEALLLQEAIKQQGSMSVDDSFASDADTVYDDNSLVWEAAAPGTSPAAASTLAAVLAASRHRSQHHMHNSSSGSFSHGSSSSGQQMQQQYVQGSRGLSHASSPMPMDLCASSSKPSMDGLVRQASISDVLPRPLAAPQGQQHQPGSSKMLQLLEQKKETLALQELLLQQQLTQAMEAATKAPATAAAAATTGKASAHHQRQPRGSSSSSRSAASARLSQGSPITATDAAAAQHCSRRHSGNGAYNSTAAALLAANVDPAVVAEYITYHQQQQQQHYACMAALANASGPPEGRKTASKRGNISPAAHAKLRQLMALQQQQILLQQELLSLLP